MPLSVRTQRFIWKSVWSGPVSDTGSLFCVNEIQLESRFTLCCYAENQHASFFRQLSNLFQPESISPCSSLQCAHKLCNALKRGGKMTHFSLNAGLQIIAKGFTGFLSALRMDEQMKSEWRWSVFGVGLMKRLWWSDYRGSVQWWLRQSASVKGTLRNISKLHPQTGWTRSSCQTYSRSLSYTEIKYRVRTQTEKFICESLSRGQKS